MKKIMNITTYEDDLNRFGDRNDLVGFYRGHGLDGLEILESGEELRGMITPGDVIGVHLRYYSAWMDLWTGDQKRLMEEFGSAEVCRQVYGGDTRQALVEAYEKNVAFASAVKPEYMVFHVSECTMDESMYREYHYSDEEVADAAAELIDQFVPGISGEPWLLLENLWYSGMSMQRPEIVRRLMDQINYPKVGVMLDIGHLLHTNMEIRSIDEGVDYIHSVLDRYNDLSFIKGVHLHQSLSGAYAKELQTSWKKVEGGYWDQMWEVMGHIFRIDTHKPFQSPRIWELLDRLTGLEYLVLEQISSNREEHDRQLKEQMAVLRQK